MWAHSSTVYSGLAKKRRNTAFQKFLLCIKSQANKFGDALYVKLSLKGSNCSFKSKSLKFHYSEFAMIMRKKKEALRFE